MIAGDQALDTLFEERINRIMDETDLDMEDSDERTEIVKRLANKLLTKCQPDAAPGTWGADQFYQFMEEEVGNMAYHVLGSLYESLCWHLVAEYDDGREDNEPFHDMAIMIRVPNVEQCRRMF
ncbi:MAG: hypothetical protein KRP56_03040 [Candidatus Methanogranum gryphiswaldense]|nr:MAG: hypothetical protein KRP56_03040 [Candidatus Methanogranum sp. U3.2.1]